MPVIRNNHVTDKTGLRRSIQTKRTRNEQEQIQLRLPPTRFPTGTPTHSKRSRKYYAELMDEREFLKHLKMIWTNKLNALKEDHKFLKKMKNVDKKQVEGLEPLFSRDDDDALTEQQEEEERPEISTYRPSISLPQTTVSTPPSITQPPPAVSTPPQLITSLEQLNQMYNIEKEEEIEPEEGEDEARNALNMLLQDNFFM